MIARNAAEGAINFNACKIRMNVPIVSNRNLVLTSKSKKKFQNVKSTCGLKTWDAAVFNNVKN